MTAAPEIAYVSELYLPFRKSGDSCRKLAWLFRNEEREHEVAATSIVYEGVPANAGRPLTWLVSELLLLDVSKASAEEQDMPARALSAGLRRTSTARAGCSVAPQGLDFSGLSGRATAHIAQAIRFSRPKESSPMGSRSLCVRPSRKVTSALAPRPSRTDFNRCAEPSR
jgi:hypothetical protein